MLCSAWCACAHVHTRTLTVAGEPFPMGKKQSCVYTDGKLWSNLFFPLIFCPDRGKNKIRSPHLGKMELKRPGENLPSLLSDSTGWALPGSCPPVGQLAPICVLRWPRRPDSSTLPLLGAPTQPQAHGSLLNRANVSSLFPEPPDGYTYMLHGAGPSTHPELLHRHFSGLNYTRQA